MVFVENLPEEKFNIVLKGVYRVRVLDEIQENPYRKARVEVLPEVVDQEDPVLVPLRLRLLERYRSITSENSNLETIPDFATFINSLASSLQLDVETKFQLLKEDSLVARAQSIEEILERQTALLDWASRFGHLRPSDPSVN